MSYQSACPLGAINKHYLHFFSLYPTIDYLGITSNDHLMFCCISAHFFLLCPVIYFLLTSTKILKHLIVGGGLWVKPVLFWIFFLPLVQFCLHIIVSFRVVDWSFWLATIITVVLLCCFWCRPGECIMCINWCYISVVKKCLLFL